MPIPAYQPLPEGVTKLSGYPRSTEQEQVERMAGFRKIVAESQYQPVRWVNREGKRKSASVDVSSASAVCLTYDRCNADSRGILCSLEPPQMIALAWKLLGNCGK